MNRVIIYVTLTFDVPCLIPSPALPASSLRGSAQVATHLVALVGKSPRTMLQQPNSVNVATKIYFLEIIEPHTYLLERKRSKSHVR